MKLVIVVELIEDGRIRTHSPTLEVKYTNIFKEVSDKCLTIKCHKPVVNIRFFSEMAGFEPAVDLTQHFLSKEAR